MGDAEAPPPGPSLWGDKAEERRQHWLEAGSPISAQVAAGPQVYHQQDLLLRPAPCSHDVPYLCPCSGDRKQSTLPMSAPWAREGRGPSPPERMPVVPKGGPRWAKPDRPVERLSLERARKEGGARAAAWGLVSQQPRALLPQSRQGGQLGDTEPATPLRPRAPAAPPLPPAPARSARPRRWHGVTCHCPGCTDLVGSREWGQRAACAQCRGRRAQCGGTGAQCGGRSPQQAPPEAPQRECHPRARHSGFPSSSSLLA